MSQIIEVIVENKNYQIEWALSEHFEELLVQIMYIIVNKVTFTVRENPKAYIKNNINPINTTSLSHS